MQRDDLPYRAMRTFAVAAGEAIDEAIADHEERLHTSPYGEPDLPPRRTEPIKRALFPDWILTDEQTTRAAEMMAKDNVSEEQAALILDVPLPVLQRALADYRGPYHKWLLARAYGG